MVASGANPGPGGEWVELLAADGSVVHGRLASPRFWLIAAECARDADYVLATAATENPIFRRLVGRLAELAVSSRPELAHIGRSASRTTPKTAVAVALALVLLVGGVFFTTFSGGRASVAALEQLNRRLVADQAVGAGATQLLPNNIPAGWRLLRLFAPNKVAVFNRNLLANLGRRATLHLDGKYKALLAVGGIGQLLTAADSLALEPQFKYSQLPPQLLGGGFGEEMETHLAAVERRQAARYKPQLLGLVTTLARKEMTRSLGHSLAAWESLSEIKPEQWRPSLAAAVASWQALEQQPPPPWYVALKSHRLLGGLLGTEAVTAAEAALDYPFSLGDDGWRVAIKPRAETLLAESPPPPSLEPFRQAFSLLPRVGWDEKALRAIAADLGGQNEADPIARLEGFAAAERALNGLGQAWRPGAWHDRRPNWDSSPILLRRIATGLVGRVEAEPQLAGVYWFLGEWARAQLAQTADPRLRRPYLELLASLETLAGLSSGSLSGGSANTSPSAAGSPSLSTASG